MKCQLLAVLALALAAAHASTLLMCELPRLLQCTITMHNGDVFDRGCMNLPYIQEDKTASYQVSGGCCNFYRDKGCKGMDRSPPRERAHGDS